MSVCEIYNDSVYDLLNDKRVKPLKVRDAPQAGCYIEGAYLYTLTDYAHAMSVYEHGMKMRSVAGTQQNATASRGHTIVTL